jgi:hypothetical protein
MSVWVCMYVCMYVFMYVCVCIYLYVMFAFNCVHLDNIYLKSNSKRLNSQKRTEEIEVDF